MIALDSKPIEATSAVEMKEQSQIPSPPQIKRVVRCHHVFSLEDHIRSDGVHQLFHGEVGIVQLESRHTVMHFAPNDSEPEMSWLDATPLVTRRWMDTIPAPLVTFTNAHPSLTRLECPCQRRQGMNLEHAEVFHDEYYNMDGHSIEWQGHESLETSTKSPFVTSSWCCRIAMILLLIGVFVLYQAHSSSHDEV